MRKRQIKQLFSILYFCLCLVWHIGTFKSHMFVAMVTIYLQTMIRFRKNLELLLVFLIVVNKGLKIGKSPWPSEGRLVTTILFSGPWCQRQNLVVGVRSCFYICSIYVAITHLATIFYNKMEQISLLNSAFDVTDQKIIW